MINNFYTWTIIIRLSIFLNNNFIDFIYPFFSKELSGSIFLGLIFIFVGFLIKISAAPFHNWSPDVYDNVPTIVTIWLNIIPKLTILILMIEIFSNISIFYINFNWDFLLLVKTGFNHYNDLLILFNCY